MNREIGESVRVNKTLGWNLEFLGTGYVRMCDGFGANTKLKR